MRFRRNARLDPSQIRDLRQPAGLSTYAVQHRLDLPFQIPQPHVVPIVVHHPHTGQPLGVVHVDLRDPFGLGRQVDRRNNRGPAYMPNPNHAPPVFTNSRARRNYQIEQHRHSGR